MTESDDGRCTAQDIVTRVSDRILNRLLDVPHTSNVHIVVPNRSLIEIQVRLVSHLMLYAACATTFDTIKCPFQVQTTLGELLEELMRRNTALVDQFEYDEPPTAGDESDSNQGKNHEGCFRSLPAIMVPMSPSALTVFVISLQQTIQQQTHRQHSRQTLIRFVTLSWLQQQF